MVFGGFSLKLLKSISPFSLGNWYPWFELLVKSPLSLKARVDSSLGCFLTCLQCIHRISLWRDTCWSLAGQHFSQAVSSTYLRCFRRLNFYHWKYYNCSTCASPTHFFNLGNLVKTENVFVLVKTMCPVWDLKNSRNTWKGEIFQKRY